MSENQRLKRVVVYGSDDDKDNWPVKLKDFIAHWQTYLDKVPEEYRDSVKIEFGGKDFYGSIEINVEIYYTRPMTQEEILQETLKLQREMELEKAIKMKQFLKLQEELGL